MVACTAPTMTAEPSLPQDGGVLPTGADRGRDENPSVGETEISEDSDDSRVSEERSDFLCRYDWECVVPATFNKCAASSG